MVVPLMSVVACFTSCSLRMFLSVAHSTLTGRGTLPNCGSSMETADPADQPRHG